MINKIIILIIAVLFILMIFFNKKVCLTQLFIKQIQVLKNDRTKKFSIWDLMRFIVFPIIISALITFGLSYQISVELAETLTTVFSLVFTILFGFAAVIVEKSVNDNPKKERVVSETFVSIVTSTVLSLFAAVISILSFALLDLSFTIMMLLLMITKRTFVIYCESDWLHIATAEIVLDVADIYLRYFW